MQAWRGSHLRDLRDVRAVPASEREGQFFSPLEIGRTRVGVIRARLEKGRGPPAVCTPGREPILNSMLKVHRRVLPICVVLCLSTAATVAVAGGPDSGFYLGGGTSFTLLTGTGTWDGYEFDIVRTLSTEGGGPLGLAWSDRLMLGLKPMIGYRFQPALAVQVGYGLNIAKSSQQSYGESNGVAYYEQGMSVEWRQRDLEILGVYQSQGNLQLALFGGLDLVSIKTDIMLYEGVEYQGTDGEMSSLFDYEDNTDKASATGFIVGAGVEFPSANGKTEVFVSAQYSSAKTAKTFFGTEDFKVDVGGVSFMAGMRWFPFGK